MGWSEWSVNFTRAEEGCEWRVMGCVCDDELARAGVGVSPLFCCLPD